MKKDEYWREIVHKLQEELRVSQLKEVMDTAIIQFKDEIKSLQFKLEMQKASLKNQQKDNEHLQQEKKKLESKIDE